MAEPSDMIVPMLRELRAEMGAFRAEVLARLDRLEDGQKSFRNALTADTLMSRLLTGDFEERIGSLEKRVRDIQDAS